MITVMSHYLIPDAPTNKFIDHNSFGFQVEAQYRLQYNKPFLAGLHYSRSTLSRYVLKYTQSSGIGDIHVREKAITRRIETGLMAGFYPEVNWLLQPYLVGHSGLCIFHTSSVLTDDDTDESIDRISESTTYAPLYSLDVGVHIVPVIWYLRGDIRFGFTRNTSIDYYILDKENAG